MKRFLGFNNFRGNFIEINIKYLFFPEIKILNHECNSSRGKFCCDDFFLFQHSLKLKNTYKNGIWDHPVKRSTRKYLYLQNVTIWVF